MSKKNKLNFWDFSGYPEFYEVRNEFYKESNGIILVLDVSLKSSLDGLDMWLREANEMGATNLPTIVIGNKVNLKFLINFFFKFKELIINYKT